jgi:hypothetical protein
MSKRLEDQKRVPITIDTILCVLRASPARDAEFITLAETERGMSDRCHLIDSCFYVDCCSTRRFIAAMHD